MSRCQAVSQEKSPGRARREIERHVQYPETREKLLKKFVEQGNNRPGFSSRSRVRHSRHIAGRRRGGRTAGGARTPSKNSACRRHRPGDRLQDAQTHAGFPFPTALRLRMGRRFPRSFMDVGREALELFAQYGVRHQESRSPDARTKARRIDAAHPEQSFARGDGGARRRRRASGAHERGRGNPCVREHLRPRQAQGRSPRGNAGGEHGVWAERFEATQVRIGGRNLFLPRRESAWWERRC